MRSRIEPYPDQVGLWNIAGDGNGFNIMAHIIHDFVSFAKKDAPLFEILLTET